MASNRLRALRNIGSRLNYSSSSLSTLVRRPAPRKLAQNLINTGNLRRYSATEPVIAPNAITNEKIDDGAVDTPELADDSVTEPKLDVDAVTGKNITSCFITDSDIENCRFITLEGDILIATNFTLTTGTMAEVAITGPSTLTGIDVELSGCLLTGCTADEIFGVSGLNLTADGLVGIAGGGGVSLNGAGSLMTIASGIVQLGVGSAGFSITSGSAGINAGGGTVSLTGSAVSMTPGWDFVRAGGQRYYEHVQFIIVKNTAEEALAKAEQALNKANSLGPCACP